MPNSQLHTSLWLDSDHVPPFPPLPAKFSADVAVIGGGIVGILTAYNLKKEGRNVCLIEARRVLEGATGNTTAKLTNCHGLIYNYLISHFGLEKAMQYALGNQGAIDWIEYMVDKFNIDCDFRRTDAYLYTTTTDEYDQLVKEEYAYHDMGLNANLTRHLDLPIGTIGGLHVTNQAEFHPVNFLRYLLHEISGEGSFVFENTRVTQVLDGDPCQILTENGSIFAKDVVVATQFPIVDPAFYFARLVPYRDYAIAARIPRSLNTSMYLPAGQGYAISTHPGEDGDLLIVSGGSHRVGEKGDTRTHYDELIAFAEKHYKVREITHSWSTQDDRTVDRLPYIGKISVNAHHVFVATGFGGWGISQGVVASQLLADLIQDRDSEYEELYSPVRFNPLVSTTSIAKIAASNVAHLVGDRFGHKDKEQLSNLQPGEARIVETEDGKVAAYRSETGQLHTVSPACTHMGCILAWNAAERTWDCPCHGSRFEVSGEVIQGPAVKNLAKIPNSERFEAKVS